MDIYEINEAAISPEDMRLRNDILTELKKLNDFPKFHYWISSNTTLVDNKMRVANPIIIYVSGGLIGSKIELYFKKNGMKYGLVSDNETNKFKALLYSECRNSNKVINYVNKLNNIVTERVNKFKQSIKKAV